MQSIPTLHLRVSLLRSHDAPRHDATQAQPPLCRKVVFVLLVSGRHVPLNCLPNSKHNLLGWLSQQAVPEHPPIAYEAASQPVSKQPKTMQAGRQAQGAGLDHWFPWCLSSYRAAPPPARLWLCRCLSVQSLQHVQSSFLSLHSAGQGILCVSLRDARDGEQE